jgi:hypothetical protein
MNKIIRLGAIKPSWTEKAMDVFCKIEYNDGHLSISGVEGPLSSGNCRGSCGQIVMDFKVTDIVSYAPGWNIIKVGQFLQVWDRWHLNDMRPACKHQMELGWKYENHHDPKTFKGEPCPVCGYEIGSKWLKEEVPQEVIDFLTSLPETDKKPAWV